MTEGELDTYAPHRLCGYDDDVACFFPGRHCVWCLAPMPEGEPVAICPESVA